MTGQFNIDITYDSDSKGNEYKIVHIDSKFHSGIALCKKCGLQQITKIAEELPHSLDGHKCQPLINPADAFAVDVLFRLHNFI